MNRFISYLIASFGILVCSISYAADQKGLANVKGCLACHDINTKKIGPAFSAVAKKYTGQKGTSDKLVKKVLDGGTGVWGDIPMPANKTMGVTEADAKKLVAWVLSLK
jgi:cytochrome c